MTSRSALTCSAPYSPGFTHSQVFNKSSKQLHCVYKKKLTCFHRCVSKAAVPLPRVFVCHVFCSQEDLARKAWSHMTHSFTAPSVYVLSGNNTSVFQLLPFTFLYLFMRFLLFSFYEIKITTLNCNYLAWFLFCFINWSTIRAVTKVSFMPEVKPYLPQKDLEKVIRAF